MSTELENKDLTAPDGKPTVSCRFYRGYTIRNHGYYDKCVWGEAVNGETGEADFHAKRLKDVIDMIDEALIQTLEAEKAELLEALEHTVKWFYSDNLDEELGIGEIESLIQKHRRLRKDD